MATLHHLLMEAGFRTRPVRLFPWLLLAFFSFLRSPAQDTPEISYDGYRSGEQSISFTDRGQRDGETQLCLSAQDHSDHYVEQWVRPNGIFLGYTVTIDNRDDNSILLARFGSPPEFATRVPKWESRTFYVSSGLFGRPGYEPVLAYFGGTYLLGNIQFSLQTLTPTQAVIHIEGEPNNRILQLSAVGSLRAEVDALHKTLKRTEIRERRNEDDVSFLEYSVFLLFSYVPIFAFILIGMLSLNPFVSLTAIRRSRRG